MEIRLNCQKRLSMNLSKLFISIRSTNIAIDYIKNNNLN